MLNRAIGQRFKIILCQFAFTQLCRISRLIIVNKSVILKVIQNIKKKEINSATNKHGKIHLNSSQFHGNFTSAMCMQNLYFTTKIIIYMRM